MKYQPGLPQHNDNVSHGSPLKEFATILAGLLGLVLLVFWVLGLAVDASVERLSAQSVERLDRLFAQQHRALPQQPAAQPQVQALMQALSSCAGVRTPARVELVESDAANAVVFQGGRVIVFTGLIKQMRSENGLAFVLAHELGHIAHRDHLRAMGRGIVVYALSVMLTGEGSALSGVLSPALAAGQAGFSREREALADAAALRTLHCHYGHVGGATEFFDYAARQERIPPALARYLGSHAPAPERIEALEGLARAAGYRKGPTTPMPAAR